MDGYECQILNLTEGGFSDPPLELRFDGSENLPSVVFASERGNFEIVF